jgi:hypothetical protein
MEIGLPSNGVDPTIAILEKQKGREEPLDFLCTIFLKDHFTHLGQEFTCEI